MNSNYPDGAANDPRAPYNQVEIPMVEFERDYSSTITRKATIESDEYEGGYTDREGYYEPAKHIGDPVKEYKEQHYTITQLLGKLISMIDQRIENINWMIDNVAASATKKDLEREIADLLEYKEEAESWEDEEIEEI